MTLEVRRQDKESTQSLVRRFTQRLQKSGILNRAKKQRFFKSPKNKETRKKEALRRVQLKKEFEEARKLAKPE